MSFQDAGLVLPLPFPNSYWVLPGQVLAGEYPGGPTREATQVRLQLLSASGIDCFFDLTQSGELAPYVEDLPAGTEYFRRPVKDHGIPKKRDMIETMAALQSALWSGRKVYVHCRAGIGRTGTVIGCLLIERGFANEAALLELNRLWQQCARSRTWDYVPETDEQVAFIRAWKASLPPLPDERPPMVEVAPLEATLPGTRSLRSRFQGALIGLAVGDALATASQGQAPGAFPPVFDMTGGGPLALPPGAWTDDTAMTLCLADSLLERNVFDPRDQVERYYRWQQQGYLSSTGKSVGVTQSVSKALAMSQWRRQVFSGSHDPKQLDPEPLCRIAPAVMFFFSSPEDAIKKAADSARVTCQAPLVLEACQLFAALLHSALSGVSRAELLQAMDELPAIQGLAPEILELLRRGNNEPNKPPARLSGDTVFEVLATALWAFRSTSNFSDGVLRAVNLGGNADMAAAIYGQLAGAHYGVEAIPRAWRNALIDKDLITEFANRLLAPYQAATPGSL